MCDTKKPETLQATGENPAILTRLVSPGEPLRRHAPAVLVTADGDRCFFVRAESAAVDLAELMVWEAVHPFTVPAGVDGAFYAMQKGDTPQ
jgi:hypothetical protein